MNSIVSTATPAVTTAASGGALQQDPAMPARLVHRSLIDYHGISVGGS